MNPLLSLFFSTLAPCLGLAAWAFWRHSLLRASARKAEPTRPPQPTRVELTAQGARDLAGPLRCALASVPKDADDFAWSLIAEDGEAMARRDAGALSFPCFLVAIPESGKGFDIRPLAFAADSVEARALEAIGELSGRFPASPTPPAPASPVGSFPTDARQGLLGIEARHVETAADLARFAADLGKLRPDAVARVNHSKFEFPAIACAIPDGRGAFRGRPVHVYDLRPLGMKISSPIHLALAEAALLGATVPIAKSANPAAPAARPTTRRL